MTEDFGEPWIFTFHGESADVFNRHETLILDDRNVSSTKLRRIAACVNFCQHIPTETLEALVKEGVWAEKVLNWLFGAHCFAGTEICDCLNGLHAEDCLLKKTLDIVGKDV